MLQSGTLVVITSMVIYHNALQCDMVFDDVSAIRENQDVLQKDDVVNTFYHDFWGSSMQDERSHKSYRPLTVLTFRLNHHFGGLDPFGFHLVNIILHTLAALLLLYALRVTLKLEDVIALPVSLLFATHPVHTEAVTGLVGRAELLAAVLSLIYFILYIKLSRQQIFGVYTVVLHIMLASILLMATLCKEQGVTISAIVILYDIVVIQQNSIWSLLNMSTWTSNPSLCVRIALIVCSTIVILVLRLSVMGSLPTFSEFDNPATALDFPYRQLTHSYLLVINAWLLLCPAQLCCDWTMGTVPVIQSLIDYRNLITLLFLLGLFLVIKFSVEKRDKLRDLIFLALLWTTVSFLPASNLLFPVGFVVAERILYMPSIGYCIGVAIVLDKLARQYQQHRSIQLALKSSFLLLLIAGGARTYTRNHDWLNDYTLFKSALRFTENNAKIWNNIGHSLEDAKPEEALYHFRKAAEIQSDDIGSHLNVGRMLKVLGDRPGAETAYRKALNLLPKPIKGQPYMARIAPGHLNLFINLGNLISMDNSRLNEVESLYKQAISMREDFLQAYINYGDVLMKMGRLNEALGQYQTGLKYSSTNADLYYNMGVVRLELGQHQAALHDFNSALNIDPDHKQSLFNSGLLLQNTGQKELYPEARQRLTKLSELEPDNEKVLFNLGMLATDEKQFQEAEAFFRRAILKKPDFKGALFNLALLLVNDLRRPLEAVPYLKENIRYHSDHIKSYILLGDLAINHLRNLTLAEQCFKTAISIDPSHVQAQHNLCVVYSEAGHLLSAEKCLIEVSILAPQENYIKDHLQIIRKKIAQQRKATSDPSEPNSP